MKEPSVQSITNIKVVGGLTILILMTLDTASGGDLLDAIVSWINRQ